MQWKFAFLSLGRPEYLQEVDVVASRFQVGGVMGSTGSSVLHLLIAVFRFFSMFELQDYVFSTSSF